MEKQLTHKFVTELKMAGKNMDLTWRIRRLLRIRLPRLMTELRRNVSNLGGSKRSARIQYGARQFSLDKSPVFHVQMHRPASMRCLFPCIRSGPDSDQSFSDEEIDSRAEKFIKQFYEEIKLQRQGIQLYEI